MSGKRPKGSLYACRELMAAADSHATTNGQGQVRFTPCPELEEEGSAFNALNRVNFIASFNRSSDRGINPNALHRSGFMPRKHLYLTHKASLGTGCVKRFTSHAPSPRRQERDNKGSALGFDLSAGRARGLGIVTRQGQDKKAFHLFGLVSVASRARKATMALQHVLSCILFHCGVEGDLG